MCPRYARVMPDPGVTLFTGSNTISEAPVPGRELHPLKSSAFHGSLFHQQKSHSPNDATNIPGPFCERLWERNLAQPREKGHELQFHFLSQISTRRFFSRPSSVLFEATGRSEPKPRTIPGLSPRRAN